MAEQGRQARTRTAPPPHEERVEPTRGIRRRGEALKKGIDAVLADIESVLEENAEECVRGYVQRGGE